MLNLSRVALKHRRTRIVATLGPASNSDETLGRLIDAGVNVFRLNFSHGDHASHADTFQRIRRVADGRPVAVMADLCGPKIRVGHFEGGSIELVEGEQVRITVDRVMGRPGLIPSEYAGLLADAEPGARVLLDDGKLQLRIEAIGDDISATVLDGGTLKDRKGMNLPDCEVSAPALTEKDKADAVFAARLGVDWMALSFVQRPSDVVALRALLAGEGSDIPIVCKIEKPRAVARISEILRETDAIMVARGDLGVELPAEEVPIIQQELVRACIEANKPVIVATQMLESMVENPRPTRAEVTDVAWAAIGGADAVMLSGETAAGAHPVEAVQTMDRILRLVEGWQYTNHRFGTLVDHREGEVDLSEGLSRAASQLSRDLGARAVVVPSHTGRSARMVSGERPSAPVVAVTTSPRIARRMALYWGTQPCVADSVDQPHPLARALVVQLGLAEPGDPLLVVWDPERELPDSAPAVAVLRA